MKKKSTLILGAGVAGLSAALGLTKKGHQVTVIEKMDHIGGLAATFKWKNFPLDLGPHKFYTILPGVLAKMKKILGKDLLKRPKTSKIRLFNTYFDYPIQIKDLILKMGPLNAFRFGWSFGMATLLNFTGRQPKNSAEYFQFRYGAAAYEMVFKPLSNKIWGNPEKLDVNLARTRVPAPTLIQLISGLVLGTKGQKEVSADHFHYPKKGIGQLSTAMAKAAGKNLKVTLNTTPTSIKVKAGKVVEVTLKNAKKLRPDYLISTIHLKHFIPLLTPKVPAKVLKASQSLSHRSLILLFLEFDRSRILSDSWAFFPDKDFIFNRLSEMKAFNPKIHPKNKTVLMVEMTCEFDDKKWNTPESTLLKKVLSDLQKAELLEDGDLPVDSMMIKIGHCYPVYDLSYKKNLETILDYLDSISNLYTIGRPGLFFYDNTDHSIDMGLTLAEHISKNRSQEEWRKQIEKFFTYKIVD